MRSRTRRSMRQAEPDTQGMQPTGIELRVGNPRQGLSSHPRIRRVNMDKGTDAKYACALCEVSIEFTDLRKHLEESHPEVLRSEDEAQRSTVRSSFTILWPFFVVFFAGMMLSVFMFAESEPTLFRGLFAFFLDVLFVGIIVSFVLSGRIKDSLLEDITEVNNPEKYLLSECELCDRMVSLADYESHLMETHPTEAPHFLNAAKTINAFPAACVLVAIAALNAWILGLLPGDMIEFILILTVMTVVILVVTIIGWSLWIDRHFRSQRGAFK